jgi:hypothetical protein
MGLTTSVYYDRIINGKTLTKEFFDEKYKNVSIATSFGVV